mmetsp:Transcript_84547/g.147138  ORF Transcript_84547/g.147138 Transcript_84547/m.147138 type:complete len:216 (-) Transcript_84547:61-708(-)
MAESVLEQIKQADFYKAEGNSRFKEGNFQKALGSYHKVFCYVNGLSIPGEKSEASSYVDMMGRSNSANMVPADRVDDVKRLKQSTSVNMAACYLKLLKYEKCVHSCTKALENGPLAKAYFRRGQAHMQLKNLDEAKADFEQARKLEPNDQAVVQELKRLQQAFKQHDAKEKKKFANMFDKMAKESKAEEPTQAEKDIAEVSGTEAPAATATATES